MVSKPCSAVRKSPQQQEIDGEIVRIDRNFQNHRDSLNKGQTAWFPMHRGAAEPIWHSAQGFLGNIALADCKDHRRLEKMNV